MYLQDIHLLDNAAFVRRGFDLAGKGIADCSADSFGF